MKAPTRVKIGPYRFVIAYDNDELLDLSEGDGLFQGNKLTITIRSTLADPIKRTALLHELMHGCVFYTDESQVTNEETAITAITVPFMAILLDNPKLTNWLLEGES